MVSEGVRVAMLKGYGILDTPNEPEFDRIVQQMARDFDVRSALVSFIDEDRQWYKARVGVDVAFVPRAISFCTHSIQRDDVTVVADACVDPLFRDNPFVQVGGTVRFYAAAPIKALNRARIGTVCIFDPVPRPAGLTEREKRQLSRHAAQVVETLEARRVSQRQARTLVPAPTPPLTG